MLDRRVIEKDAAALTALRIKAARVLSSLNQEAFAERFNFTPASVKNWEIGRSLPREETVGKFIDALNECGVHTTRDWLLFGLGAGPNHVRENGEAFDISMAMKPEMIDFSAEISQFERVCIRNNIKPLVITVSDDLMRPFFFPGDIVGAESVELKSLASNPEVSIEYPFLVEIAPNNFQPRYLSRDPNGLVKFWRTNQENIMGEINHIWLGRIIWLRKKPN